MRHISGDSPGVPGKPKHRDPPKISSWPERSEVRETKTQRRSLPNGGPQSPPVHAFLVPHCLIKVEGQGSLLMHVV